jgi:hypothetical protein
MAPNWLREPLRQPAWGFVDNAARGQLTRYEYRSTWRVSNRQLAGAADTKCRTPFDWADFGRWLCDAMLQMHHENKIPRHDR